MSTEQETEKPQEIRSVDMLESVVTATLNKMALTGDAAQLDDLQKQTYYRSVAESLGLNPWTKPFDWLAGHGGKLQLYANKNAAEQLRKKFRVSVTALSVRREADVYIVIANVCDREGRTDAGTGVVSVAGLRGDPLCNAMMKAETKAKRRATLSICGLGMLDESEVETIAGVTTRISTDQLLPAEPRQPADDGRYVPTEADLEADAEYRASPIAKEIEENAKARKQKTISSVDTRHVKAGLAALGIDPLSYAAQQWLVKHCKQYQYSTLTETDCKYLVGILKTERDKRNAATGPPPKTEPATLQEGLGAEPYLDSQDDEIKRLADLLGITNTETFITRVTGHQAPYTYADAVTVIDIMTKALEVREKETAGAT